jgi:hypothetical protein
MGRSEAYGTKREEKERLKEEKGESFLFLFRIDEEKRESEEAN